MTASPFSNVVGHDPEDSTFQRVESATPETTSATADRPDDTPTEPAGGVEIQDGRTHQSGQDETPGDQPSG